MKKIIIVGILIIISITGCTSNRNDNLKDYYGELTSKSFKQISMEKVKKDLKEFEYEYKLQEYSKEEKLEYEELGINDYSDNKFKDDNGSFISITFNEESKKVSDILYSQKENNTTINTIRDELGSSTLISGDNIEKQKEIINNLNLYKDLNEIVENYFKVVNNLYNKKDMTIEDLSNILKMDYEIMEDEDEYHSEENYKYLFVSDFGEGAYIDVETDGMKVIYIKLNIYFGQNSNYNLTLSATNENELDEKSPFRLDTNISTSLNKDSNDKSGNPKEEALIESSTELFNLVFKNKEINFYSENYTEKSEKENILLYAKLDKDKDENGISFESKRVIEEDRPYDVDKTFKVKLKKGESLKIKMEMENNKNLSIPIVITLKDLSTKKCIYSKSVDNTNEKIFTTEKAHKDGEYEISVGMSDLSKYKFEILLIKE
ncbi:hypothetical protein [Terrisporobacter vanillatitrophus]|uniref:hypothetical protein n=1 Tax=Terrisporobacter vanillatitrophus TaxID=3058402 RepID=UPI003369914F